MVRYLKFHQAISGISFDDHCIETPIMDGEIRILSNYVYSILIAGNSLFAINLTLNWGWVMQKLILCLEIASGCLICPDNKSR